MTVNPGSFWLGLSVAFIRIGVLSIAVAGLFARRGEISGSIDKIEPRQWSDEEPKSS